MVSSMVKLELQSFQCRLMVHDYYLQSYINFCLVRDGKLATTTSGLISIFVYFFIFRTCRLDS
jgi:hypothetical protein